MIGSVSGAGVATSKFSVPRRRPDVIRRARLNSLLDAAVGERARAHIRARDVSLAVERPHGISILNVLAGQVTAIEDTTEPVLDVEVAVGSASLTARITRRSLAHLNIKRGQDIYVMIKAVSFDQRSVGYE